MRATTRGDRVFSCVLASRYVSYNLPHPASNYTIGIGAQGVVEGLVQHAAQGDLDSLRQLYDKDPEFLTSEVLDAAACNGHSAVLKWLLE